jgi:hypothetical protein
MPLNAQERLLKGMVNNPASFLKDIKNFTSCGPPSINANQRSRLATSHLGSKGMANRKRAIRNNFMYNSSNIASARLTSPRDMGQTPDGTGST